jgi:hypothetical protein
LAALLLLLPLHQPLLLLLLLLPLLQCQSGCGSWPRREAVWGGQIFSRHQGLLLLPPLQP